MIHDFPVDETVPIAPQLEASREFAITRTVRIEAAMNTRITNFLSVSTIRLIKYTARLEQLQCSFL